MHIKLCSSLYRYREFARHRAIGKWPAAQDEGEKIGRAKDDVKRYCTQALNSPRVQQGMLDILLNYAGLWEALRSRAAEVR